MQKNNGTGTVIARLIDKLDDQFGEVDWQAERLIDWLTDLLIEWLIAWLERGKTKKMSYGRPYVIVVSIESAAIKSRQ